MSRSQLGWNVEIKKFAGETQNEVIARGEVELYCLVRRARNWLRNFPCHSCDRFVQNRARHLNPTHFQPSYTYIAVLNRCKTALGKSRQFQASKALGNADDMIAVRAKDIGYLLHKAGRSGSADNKADARETQGSLTLLSAIRAASTVLNQTYLTQGTSTYRTLAASNLLIDYPKR